MTNNLPGCDLLILDHRAWEQRGDFADVGRGLGCLTDIWYCTDTYLKNLVPSQNKETEEMVASSRCPRYEEVLFQNNPLAFSGLWFADHCFFCVPLSVCLIASSTSCGKEFNHWTHTCCMKKYLLLFALKLPPTSFIWCSSVLEQGRIIQYISTACGHIKIIICCVWSLMWLIISRQYSYSYLNKYKTLKLRICVVKKSNTAVLQGCPSNFFFV